MSKSEADVPTGASPAELRAEIALLRAEIVRLRAMVPGSRAARERPEEAHAGVAESSRSSEQIEFAVLLATMLQGVVCHDAAGEIVWMNPAAERILGKTREAFLGETSVSVKHHTIREDGSPFPGVEHPVMVALQTGRDVQGVTMGVYNPQKMAYRWINVSAVPVWQPGADRPGRVYALFDDVTDRKQAEEALRASEERFRSAIENSRDGINLLDLATGRYVVMSPSQVALTGFTAEEINGLTAEEAYERVHPDDRERSVAQQREVAAGRDLGPVEYRWKVKSGEYRWFSDSRTVVRDQHGRAVSLVGVSRDVTEHKRTEEALRQSERLYRGIGESIDYGIWVCAPDGRNTYASESFLTLVGITQEQCSNFGWGDVLHPDDAERTIAAWQDCVRTGGTWDIEHRVRGVDGRWHPILARGVPVKNERGEVVCWAGINLDISQLKQAEADLREREAALREVDSQKNRFLAVLSHELRNPLTPITNSLYILDRVAPGGEQASRAKAVIARQVSQLTRLVDDLLDVSRVVSGKLWLQRARFDLALLLHRTADDHRTGFAEAGIVLEVLVGSEPVWMVGDEFRLAQATGNLLGNATKFTEPGGRVVLALELDPATATGVIFVRDTGIGIRPELMHRIFEPFVQADSSLDRTKSGLGLGLALVKSVIELHGGTVEAHSDGPGQGAEFVIRVPVEIQATLLPQTDHTASDHPPSRRILIIEDNADAADSLREMLELGDHRVEVAYSGQEGIQKATRFGPDVVFCDIGLPGMDGYEVARAFRSDDRLRSTYLVALSGYAQPEDQQRAAEVGFDGHIAKPPVIQKIYDVLSALPERGAAGRRR
jgi:PAS domain S-box-containing protein